MGYNVKILTPKLGNGQTPEKLTNLFIPTKQTLDMKSVTVARFNKMNTLMVKYRISADLKFEMR
ncbi:MAG: hypothetical protein KI790_10680 [Cyclobacteriaceae bacterium]|nr:hypothetical protein [Cyclobacteriaceae bacterium HetDA_MAG_MS6]